MKSPIKIIKRKQDEEQKKENDSDELTTSAGQESVERRTREMASTIKGWVSEFQQRKRSQSHSFPRFNVTPASQNT
ncbi:MAG TPA: hypothetical protein VJ372_03050 [Pyrinomonadaceae bacterium]|jgi:hypothetical protein|nr:hypothetical protein [Pyrinomonadaceae bacterium]